VTINGDEIWVTGSIDLLFAALTSPLSRHPNLVTFEQINDCARASPRYVSIPMLERSAYDSLAISFAVAISISMNRLAAGDK
jgi:hypothetical protein